MTTKAVSFNTEDEKIPDSLPSNDFFTRDFSGKSSLALRLFKANNSARDSKKLWLIFSTIAVILFTVHSLSFLVTEFGIADRRNNYNQYTASEKCMESFKNSKFDILNTNDYDKWMGKKIGLFYRMRLFLIIFYSSNLKFRRVYQVKLGTNWAICWTFCNQRIH